ncbi:hypothetical protein ACVWXO_003562 [Bradyrhizobium sp. LM2.7]
MATICLEDLGLVVHHDAARWRLPTDIIAIQRNGLFHVFRVFIVKMCFDNLEVAGNDLLARECAVRDRRIDRDRAFDLSLYTSHFFLLDDVVRRGACCRRLNS